MAAVNTLQHPTTRREDEQKDATHVGCALTGHAEGQTERMAQFAIANTGLTVEERGKVIQTAKECCGYNFGEGVFQWQTAVPEE